MDSKEIESQLEKLKEYFNNITQDNVKEMCRKISEKQLISGIKLAKESLKLDNLDLDVKKIYGELTDKYKYKDQKVWDKRNELESQIYADPKYYKVKIKYNEQKCICEQYKCLYEAIKTASFQIKNVISIMKYEAGMW